MDDIASGDPRSAIINDWRRSTGRDIVMTRLETDPGRIRVRELSPTREVINECYLEPGDDPVDVGLTLTGLIRYTVPRRWRVRIDDPHAARSYVFGDIEARTAGEAKLEAARRAINADTCLGVEYGHAADQEVYLTATAQYAVIERCTPTAK